MAKLSLGDIANLQNESTVTGTINANNSLIETAMDNTLSRDGTSPNQMSADLDMNSHNILNLPEATVAGQPVEFDQFEDAIEALTNGAVVNASYVTLSNDLTLQNERALTAGTNISVVDGGAGNTVTVGLNNTELNALGNVSTTGLETRTGTGTYATRTIAGTANEITATNGNGVSGNPTLSLPAALTFTGKTVTGGTTTGATFTAGTISSNTIQNNNTATLTDTNFTLQDDGDNTKQGVFQLSGITTGNTRTLTWPNASTTIVGTDATQTLTNKTLTSPTLTTPVLGTPSSGTLTSCTGLPLGGLTTQGAYTFVGNNTGSSASPTAVDIAAVTLKGSPAGSDLVLISDQAASGAWKRATVSSISVAGSVASLNGATGAISLSVVSQTFTASGTYTPTTGMKYCIMECWGGGGGGGGTVNTSATNISAAGGGGAGGYSRKTASSATIGASQTVTIGAAGTGASAGNNPGGNGGDTSVGALCIAKGGTGGGGAATAFGATGGAGGVAGTGDDTGTGMAGSWGYTANGVNTNYAVTGQGGSGSMGGGGLASSSNSTTNITGNAGTGKGSGGAGGYSGNAGGASAGGAGTAGYIRITEYVIA